jgi:transcriptional regulator GlxA family with amidase domain
MNSTPLEVTAVIVPGFELLDLYGPLELFGILGDRVKISVAAEQEGIVASGQKARGVADLALSEVAQTDILLVPGGIGTRTAVSNSALLGHLQRLSEVAKYTASVCTGSALLAKAGILDGVKATSNKRAFTWVAAQGPHVHWIQNARWVEDGKFFTSSGISAGMDMTLALIGRLFGPEVRNEVAARTEYLWNSDSTNDPFAVA